MKHPLFSGPGSIRDPRERPAFFVTILTLPATLAAVTYVLKDVVSAEHIALLAVVGMLYIAISRGRLLGNAVRVQPHRFPEIYEVVVGCAGRLGVAVPHVFIRDDLFVPVAAVGLGEPYALVLSSTWVEHLAPDELRFLVGRELGHIAAGHTRVSSLLSVNGRENAVLSVLFGLWLRRMELSADRAGLLCCGSVEIAVRAIAVSTLLGLGRTVDRAAFDEQRAEIAAEPNLRMGEWIGSMPYSTTRLDALDAFAASPLYAHWSLERPVFPLPTVRPTHVYGSIWRRSAAWICDVVVMSVLLPKTLGQAPIRIEGTLPPGFGALHEIGLVAGGGGTNTLTLVALFVYSVLLVAFANQTIGMMILDLRVTDGGHRRVGLWRAFWRYAFFVLTLPVGIFAIFRRVQPYERLSGTRLVDGGGSLALTRSAETLGVA